MRLRRCVELFLISVALSCDPAIADVVQLAGGGIIRGQIVGDIPTLSASTSSSAEEQSVKIDTLGGGRVEISGAEVVRIQLRPVVVEEYETRTAVRPATVEGHWQLLQWCREQKLDEQAAQETELLLVIDPNHEPTRALLGQSLINGQWLTRDEEMALKGLVPYENRYISPQELALIQERDERLDLERSWFRNVRLWHSRLTRTEGELQRSATASLLAIRDPHAIPALEKNFRNDSDAQIRGMYVSILNSIGGDAVVPALVTQSLFDVDYETRYAAIGAIQPSQYAAAVPAFLKALRHEQNDIVKRAGLGLEQTGDERAVEDLIGSLVTNHKYRIRVPDRSGTLSFSTAGTYGQGGTPLPPEIEGALRTGQLPNGVIVNDPAADQLVRWKTVTISVNHANKEVLAALKKITGADFGYDEAAWRQWWAAKRNGLLGLN